MPTIQISLRLPKELRDELETIAIAQGRSLSNLIVELVKIQLDCRKAKKAK